MSETRPTAQIPSSAIVVGGTEYRPIDYEIYPTLTSYQRHFRYDLLFIAKLFGMILLSNRCPGKILRFYRISDFRKYLYLNVFHILHICWNLWSNKSNRISTIETTNNTIMTLNNETILNKTKAIEGDPIYPEYLRT